MEILITSLKFLSYQLSIFEDLEGWDHVYCRWPRSIYRPIYRSTVDRLSADSDSPPPIGRLSIDSRSIVGRLSADISTDSRVDRYSIPPSILDRYVTDT